MTDVPLPKAHETNFDVDESILNLVSARAT